ncbi:MAG TPA: DUF488 domain-containing protein [Chryseosolibacter sp.]|nr:DUF488 domain-containing protein [Chryseosolibacter sp.]
MSTTKHIWTIGHSTHTFEHFLSMLQSFSIDCLIDVRTFPGSRRYPHFNKENLQTALRENGIGYQHFIALGGRRKPKEDSSNTAWRHPNFRGYADHMASAGFNAAFAELQSLAESKNVAYMCSEAVWWRCHRSLISDALKAKGWNVRHIMDVQVSKEHPYTSPARVEQGNLFYN